MASLPTKLVALLLLPKMINPRLVKTLVNLNVATVDGVAPMPPTVPSSPKAGDTILMLLKVLVCKWLYRYHLRVVTNIIPTRIPDDLNLWARS